MQNAVALGTFDGLHKGHLAVLDLPDCYCKNALIFKIPPKCVKIGVTQLLLTPEEKVERLKKSGFKVTVLDFNQVEHLTPAEFLSFVKEEFKPSLISCGFNYRFGFKGEGDTAFLRSFCEKNNIKLQIADPVCEEGDTVSSSRIRNSIRNGNIIEANHLLGYDFSFSATVKHGDARGRVLGFPTINQQYPKGLVIPKFGVYKTEALVEGKKYSAITNLGNRPTYPVDYIISETFIKDFSGDLYGKSIKIILKDFIREEKKFSTLEELKNQVMKDIRR